ncbi:MAG TPA: hypothetical protein VJU82_03560 [Acidobacteriaceae bacterium]|nr:hypothetical protein [Acidobacteriaceae bacterium]
MTRTDAASSLVDHAQIESAIERTNITRNAAMGSFLILLTAEFGALAVVAMLTFALLALV